MKLIQQQVGLDRFNAEMREYLLKAFKTTMMTVLALRHGDRGAQRGAVVSTPAENVSPYTVMPSGAAGNTSVVTAGVAGGGTLATRVEALSAQLGARMSTLEDQIASHATAQASHASAQNEQLSSRMSALEGMVSSRLTGLEERIAALTCMLRGDRITQVAE